MPEHITPENLVNNLMETLAENSQNQKHGSFEEEISNAVTSQYQRLFNRQKPVHNILGGGKSADVLLWRNKKISASVLIGATIIWVLFEWLNYHLLSLVCFGIALGMLAQFLWSNATGVMKRSPSEVPRIQLPDEWFVDIGKMFGAEVNRTLRILQDISCNGNMRQFLMAVAILLTAAMFGTWFNFLSLCYLGFVAAHILPVLYEKYEDQVDGFADNLIGQMQHHYKKIDDRVLSKMPTRKWAKKSE